MRARREGGFTYFGVLFLVALMGIASSAVGTMWQTASRQAKERELLAIGAEFRTAIERYVRATPSGPPRYPRALEDLVRDPRVPGVARHLRRIYADPITGRAEWGLVPAPDGGFMGVHSLSESRPLKRAGFRPVDARFEAAERYSEWTFVYRDRSLAIRSATSPKTLRN